MHELTTQCSLIQPTRHMIGKSQQHATLDRVGGRAFLAGIQPFPLRDVEELLEQWPDLSRGLGMDTDLTAAIEIVPVAVRIAPRAHEHEEIRLRLAAK